MTCAAAHEWDWLKSDSGHDMRICAKCGAGLADDFWDEIRVAAERDRAAATRLLNRPGLPATYRLPAPAPPVFRGPCAAVHRRRWARKFVDPLADLLMP